VGPSARRLPAPPTRARSLHFLSRVYRISSRRDLGQFAAPHKGTARRADTPYPTLISSARRNAYTSSFRPALEMKLHQDVADMMTGRLNAEEQSLGYLTVGEAFAEEIENLKLSLRETRIALAPSDLCRRGLVGAPQPCQLLVRRRSFRASAARYALRARRARALTPSPDQREAAARVLPPVFHCMPGGNYSTSEFKKSSRAY
jgi:hypothetical protein